MKATTTTFKYGLQSDSEGPKVRIRFEEGAGLPAANKYSLNFNINFYQKILLLLNHSDIFILHVDDFEQFLK